RLMVIADRRSYRPGDTAELLVLSPFSPAEGLLTLERSGIAATQRFSVTGPTTTVKVPVTEGLLPGASAHITLVGIAKRTDTAADPTHPARPSFASGEVFLRVSTESRQLSLSVKPKEETLQPGGETSISLDLKDAAGKPAKGEVAVVVVDEAILALAD